ncbi:MAG: hypothetical protein G01um101416_455 [Microgenomates group bacterium Gr01-1014_16]|nr:MAG: hypothetical protein G01um101416_455 [Microgenomates group bacterium Gr01-1014_16]
MAIDFLEKKEHGSLRVRKWRKWAEGVATVTLAAGLVFGTGILGSWLYIKKEGGTLAKRKSELVSEVAKLAREEVQVIQTVSRSDLVMAEAKNQGKVAMVMERVTPEDGVEVVSWGWANGSNTVDVQSDYPYLLERYTTNLANSYPGLKVGRVVWSRFGKWNLDMMFDGDQE